MCTSGQLGGTPAMHLHQVQTVQSLRGRELLLAEPAVTAERERRGKKSETKIVALRMTVKPYRVNYTTMTRQSLQQELPCRERDGNKKNPTSHDPGLLGYDAV